MLCVSKFHHNKASIIFSPQLDEHGKILREVLTPTTIISHVFIGLSILTLIAALLSWKLIKMKKAAGATQ
ncbi:MULTISPECIES: hypothetical protein [Providencia]|uniref:hypothetical protein n=1 Tax=Providencia TaxID=586 RepID=UPI0024B184C5